MPPDDTLARQLSATNRRLTALEERVAANDSQLAQLAAALQSQQAASTAALQTIAKDLARAVGCLNQLGQLLSHAEVTQATVSAPQIPWQTQ